MLEGFRLEGERSIWPLGIRTKQWKSDFQMLLTPSEMKLK